MPVRSDRYPADIIETVAKAIFEWDTSENSHEPQWTRLASEPRDVWREAAVAMDGQRHAEALNLARVVGDVAGRRSEDGRDEVRDQFQRDVWREAAVAALDALGLTATLEFGVGYDNGDRDRYAGRDAASLEVAHDLERYPEGSEGYMAPTVVHRTVLHAETEWEVTDYAE